MSRVAVAVVCSACLCGNACRDGEKQRLKQTTIPTYDTSTGKLKELTYDANKNGKIDTWTQMDGARPVSTRQDLNEDGKLDRWEYYDAAGKLVKVGSSSKNAGTPDSWAYPDAQGRIERVEEDTNGDGRLDKWEQYESGTLKTAAFDENHDGVVDRRLTYDAGGSVILIETEPDGKGGFKNKAPVR